MDDFKKTKIVIIVIILAIVIIFSIKNFHIYKKYNSLWKDNNLKLEKTILNTIRID